MSTVEKGDEFEERAYSLIKKAIDSGQLGLIANQCQVFRKKGYYSEKRKGDIIFDLTIEVWPPSADRYTLLYIIECKSLSKKVPVDDLEEFLYKVKQVSGVNAKGVFITNQGFQKGAYNIGESEGMMLIQLNFDETHKILLHKIHRSKSIITDKLISHWDETIESILNKAFDLNTKVTGLRKYSSNEIENIAKEIIFKYNPDVINYFKPIQFDDFIQYLKNEFGLNTVLDKELHVDSNGNQILGYFDRNEKTIYIDPSISNTDRFPFVFSHELGHFILHMNLKMNQRVYDSFSDSQFSFLLGKHVLVNEKNWIEWQANQFAVSLILPQVSLFARVVYYQYREGIRNKGTIYVDSQKVNQMDFNNIVSFLSKYFQVTKANIIYRLKDIGILTFENDNVKQIGSIISYI